VVDRFVSVGIGDEHVHVYCHIWQYRKVLMVTRCEVTVIGARAAMGVLRETVEVSKRLP
jgi:hypothetical protein